MAGNTLGTLFKVTTFGESHGAALGCVIDGCPAGIDIDESFIKLEMERRKPGARQKKADGSLAFNAAVTSRSEEDSVEILSGVFEGKSTGTPIAMLIRNTSQISKDYSNIKDKFRPGHADYTFFQKYGIRDYRGGGRSSGRETCARVAAGAIAKMFLKKHGINITAYTERAAGISIQNIDLTQIENNFMRAPDNNAATKMLEKIEDLRKEGNSTGGIISCIIKGVPAGLGEPVFNKCDALLAKAILSIGAVKGIEFGNGFMSADSTGKDNNDAMRIQNGSVHFETNNAGGILGGISNGNDIFFRLAVKPVPSIYIKQETLDTSYSECDILIEGRHDVCLCPRIVPVVEAMSALVIADLYLCNQTSKSTSIK